MFVVFDVGDFGWVRFGDVFGFYCGDDVWFFVEFVVVG